MKKSRLLGAVCACIIAQIASTPVLSAPVFPGEVQACITSMVCTDPTLVQQGPTFSAYTYSDGGVSKYLIEYSLSSSSNETTLATTTQLSGTSWLGANAVYDLTQEQHFFTLYLDGVTPTPFNLWDGDSDGLDVGLSMPTADLLAGSSYFRMYLDGEIFVEGDLLTYGDLGFIEGHSFFTCASDTCEVGAELNLLNLQFVQSGSVADLVINPTDPRSLVYSQYSQFLDGGDEDFFISQSYQVVPLPPALWFFGSGLLGLIGIARHKKSA